MRHRGITLALLVLTLLYSGLFAPVGPPGGGSGGTNHNLLSATHSDSTTGSGVNGDIIRFNGTWQRLGIGTNGQCLVVTAGLPVWGSCSTGGAPDSAAYITQIPNATLLGEQALSLLASGILLNTTGTGVLSIAVAGTDYVIPAGNVATATALAANGANCSPGNGAGGVSAAGAAESCTDYMEEPAGNGLVARTSANTSANRSITGTPSEISVNNGDGVSGNPTISLPSTIDLTSKTVIIPNGTTLPATCVVGQEFMDTDATSGQRFYLCQSTNTWILQGDGGGGGGSSSVGSANAIQASNGSGAFLDSGCTGASGAMSCPNGFTSSGVGAGIVTLKEGTVVGAGTNVGEHNIGIDSTDSLLKSRENGGALVTYYSTANLPSALASNPANCGSGQFPLGVDASGAAENCTALPTSITGTANEVAASASTGAITLSLPSTVNLAGKTVRIPSGTTLPATCTVADEFMDTDATLGQQFYLCTSTNTWTLQGDGGGGGGITSLASQTGAGQTITRGVGIGGSSAANDHSFTFDATELGALTWSAGGSASLVWDFNLSAGDPQVTFGNGVVNVTSGNLQKGGNNVITAGSGEISAITSKATPTTSDLLLIEDAAASNAKKQITLNGALAANDARTKTFTNTTLDSEGTGNAITIPQYWDLDLVAVSGGTATHVWNDDPLSTACTPLAVIGTNRTTGYCTFPDVDGDYGRQITRYLPPGWTGSFDAVVWWKTTGTGNARFQVATKCYDSDAADDGSFNTASIVTAAAGTSGRPNRVTLTGITTTGCAANQLMRVRLFRNRTEASDTLNAALDIEKVIFVARVTH